MEFFGDVLQLASECYRNWVSIFCRHWAASYRSLCIGQIGWGIITACVRCAFSGEAAVDVSTSCTISLALFPAISHCKT